MGINYDQNTNTYKVDALDRVTTTTVTASSDTVTSWINSVYSEYQHREIEHIIGVDVKWLPHGYPGDYRIYMLNLFAGQRCLVFQIYYCDSIPSSLRSFLRDEKLRFVALGLGTLETRITKERLQSKYNLLLENLEDVMETTKVKMQLEVVPQNVEDFALAVLQMEVKKPELLNCKWSHNPLSTIEIEYATIDALVPYKAAMRLHYNLFSSPC